MIATGAAQAQETKLTVLFLDSQGFFGGIQKGIVEGAADSNVSLISSNSESDPTIEAEFLDVTIGAGVDAVIMSPVSFEASVPALERVVEDKLIYIPTLVLEASKPESITDWMEAHVDGIP